MSLDALVQLHETDERLAEINELKDGLPELLLEQENEFNEMNENQKNNTEKIDTLSKELTSYQNTLTDHNNKLEKYNDQLLQVTNNKEYDAVLLEIDHLKNLITDLNTQVSTININKKELESLIESNIPLIEELSNKINVNKNELSEKMAETDKEEALLSKHKTSLLKKITNTQHLSQYTKLFEKYGQGMAHIMRRSCNHCYTQLPPQLLVEIEYDKKIITCPSCSVFLYHKKDND
tara:strand:- start:1766 stop:2473 length:708 start_codon:yes stop_codon:yes gene_type:complete